MKSYVAINERLKTPSKNGNRISGIVLFILLFLGGWLLLFPSLSHASTTVVPNSPTAATSSPNQATISFTFVNTVIVEGTSHSLQFAALVPITQGEWGYAKHEGSLLYRNYVC